MPKNLKSLLLGAFTNFLIKKACNTGGTEAGKPGKAAKAGKAGKAVKLSRKAGIWYRSLPLNNLKLLSKVHCPYFFLIWLGICYFIL